MNEYRFEQENSKRWSETEKLIGSSSADPRLVATRYSELNDDLAYVRAHFAGGRTEAYLNRLLARAHGKLYRKKRSRPGRFLAFWTEELPMLWYVHRRYLLLSFVFFLTAAGIGVFSSVQDPFFVRGIMGDVYVNMTLGNIEKEDPMAVYKSMNELEMFLAITINNVRVSFYTFIGGILGGVGTLFILLQNGIMLGAFQYFFHEFDLLWETVLVIWIHGALEISAIVIAGGAGLTMGAGLLFPGSYPRLYAFRRNAMDGLKMVTALVPFFIIAGALESWVTRLTDMPVALSLAIILGSFAVVIFYFVLYPAAVAKHHTEAVSKARAVPVPNQT